MPLLLALTFAALLVHGYHPFAEDAEIYLPGVEKILNPNLFPVGQEFFSSHASLTLFPNLVAWFVGGTHLPLEYTLFLWYIASIFLLLLACWELSGLCFSSVRARCAAVLMVAALLTIPVAGTALYIADQYLNPRDLAAFAGVFAVARSVETKYGKALLWLVFAAAVHPLMWVFPFSFCVLLIAMRYYEQRSSGIGKRETVVGAALLFMVAIPLAPRTGVAYHEAAKLHSFHYIQNWAWYEWLGALAPIALFWWFARIARARGWRAMELVSGAFMIYDAIYFVAALALDLPPRFESLARLQPLRSLHLLYMVMFLTIGGLLGEYVLKERVWRWLALFVPLAAGMWFAQGQLFPASAHVEWPGVEPRNRWAQAFWWVRKSTPVDAVFALDPRYMAIAGEDEIGFRCLAQRSRLADAIKDNAVVSMFPLMADAWWAQVRSQSPWSKLQLSDFENLKRQYGASWVVVQQPGVSGLECAYENGAVKVCRIP
ncbi:MAG TPA: hypothetical protein VFO39_16700 [Candidatus Sulfotelmatobacter sp.]|nr:hypothetical protein [Candidatus Sulfotelmatobacter sp.]